MKFARTKNTLRNIAFGSLDRLINIVLPFASRTVILYVMGTKYLGLSSLFSSILSFLSLTELGIGAAMVYSMYKPIAENDHTTICALMNLYKKLYRIIGTVVLVLGLALMPFLKILVPEELPPDINLYLLYFIYLINAVLSYWLFAYKNALLQAYQRSDINSKIATIITFASYTVMLTSLFLTRNYYAYVIWLPIFTILTNVLRLVFVNRNFPGLEPAGEVPAELKKSIFKKTSALIGTKLNTVVLNAADNLVMSAFLGLTVIAMYGNYHYIMTSVIGFLALLILP
jgi:O-antigen/teichoic acid export membrane protein